MDGKVFQRVKVGKWEIETPLCAGDIADLYVSGQVVVKIVRDEADNDLMEAEQRVLAASMEPGANSHHWYLPKILDSFKVSGRAVNVTEYDPSFQSLTSIKALVPNMDFRHVVWMGNRLLSALGGAHQLGFVHGAVTPAHLLYRPKDHGMRLVGWGGSVEISSRAHVPVMAKDWHSIYPREVEKKWPAHVGTDIYMAMKSLRSATGEVPRRFRQIFEHCFADSPNARPADAWILQDRWKAAAEAEYGKPQFLELVVPVQ